MSKWLDRVIVFVLLDIRRSNKCAMLFDCLMIAVSGLFIYLIESLVYDLTDKPVIWILIAGAVQLMAILYFRISPLAKLYVWLVDAVGIIPDAVIDALNRIAKPRVDAKPFRPPASRLVSVMRFVFSKQAFDSIFSQLVLDYREEYYEALANEENWKARWRGVQLYLVLIATIFSYLGVSVLKYAVKIFKMAG
ncbi:MAG: hypothetical protein K5863_09130 [Nitratireductor sp.]|uniref:hypothetical protein n=1 Tax=Nitratireductor sp. TaxID=1872084 RepID=UPI0026342831|nr:hypothetical protein [Nitratireductor sp.]MCV0350227.1 hypothetical protein [Nitratireductor sp.]